MQARLTKAGSWIKAHGISNRRFATLQHRTLSTKAIRAHNPDHCIPGYHTAPGGHTALPKLKQDVDDHIQLLSSWWSRMGSGRLLPSVLKRTGHG